jgi:hypothetical protein
MWHRMAAMNSSAAQWWICRTKSPPRTSKERSTVVWNARDIGTPRSASYVPE